MTTIARHYDVVALQTTVWFNKYGDHDHNGMIFILSKYRPVFDYLNERMKPNKDSSKKTEAEIEALRSITLTKLRNKGLITPQEEEKWLPRTIEAAQKPHPLVRPLVLRVRKGEEITIRVTNLIRSRKIGLHLVGPGTNASDDGTHVGTNPTSLIEYSKDKTYFWNCNHEGVFVFHDGGDFRGEETGTNTHGLFGALIVEPETAWWTNPETGQSTEDGLYVDVHQRTSQQLQSRRSTGHVSPYPQFNNPNTLSKPYPEDPMSSFREYVIFIHDEPEWVAPHTEHPERPCVPLEHPNHTAGSLMPISYRAEPMVSREYEIWKRIHRGETINPMIINEEQHHSSWAFGDPDTPILKAYLGDPVRIRLVHAGVKETHVFHLHVYEWHAVPYNEKSNIIDAITISPQTGHTFIPLYGAGNKQGVPGDVIWHCHLYPHFHHGMWGMFRTFDYLQTGQSGAFFSGGTQEYLDQPVLSQADTITLFDSLASKNSTLQTLQWQRSQLFDRWRGASASLKTSLNNQILNKDTEINALEEDIWDTKRKIYAHKLRRIGHYPDLTPVSSLIPLPDRETPPSPTATTPGFPLFLDGTVGQKSKTPPWHKKIVDVQNDPQWQGIDLNQYSYREPTTLEISAFRPNARAGELFGRFAYPDNSQTPFGLNSPTIKHDIDVLMTPIEYNDYGWWDPHGHIYKLKEPQNEQLRFSEVVHEAYHHAVHHLEEQGLTVEEIDQKKKEGLEVHLSPTRQEPLYLRCRKTDVLELTFENKLERYIPETSFDSQWPMKWNSPNGSDCQKYEQFQGECGLHVHIVKFDPICSDGASTGWNYISAPELGKKLIYRWWADDEFGTIFFHDHLFANYRQKHGLFGSLLVEPEGAEFLDPTNLSIPKIAGREAVIAYTDSNGQPKIYREFCFGNADWVPLYKLNNEPHDEVHPNPENGQTENHDHDGPFTAKTPILHHGKLTPIGNTDGYVSVRIQYGIPLEAPEHLDSHDDNGVFAVNYRCEPLEERKGDPSLWFDSKHWQDPSTDIYHSNVGEPIRMRLIQGSHEEQHSFQVHGMRWRRFWKDNLSPMRNQQTLGISEAFTFDILDPTRPGDYLWKYASSEDLWLGAWGLIRVHTSSGPDAPIPILVNPPHINALEPTEGITCRRFKVVAKAKELPYRSDLKDPHGLLYHLIAYAEPGDEWQAVTTSDTEPLILRCRQGEMVEVTVVNQLPVLMKVEPYAPRLPLEGELPAPNIPESERPNREISRRVSLHADLVTYNVAHSDGANVGLNPDTTVDQNGSKRYQWLADCDPGVVLLQDMADFRNHRHHGLVGALVVEPEDATPYKVEMGKATSRLTEERWYGPRVTTVNDANVRVEEMVLILQDGLRLFKNNGTPIWEMPVAVQEQNDAHGVPEVFDLDTEDQGIRAFNYRSDPQTDIHNGGTIRFNRTPPTPLILVPRKSNVCIHFVGACDKPRNHSFTIHGHSWKEWEYLENKSPQMASEGGLSSGTVRSYRFTANKQPGDYMYRSGVLKWSVQQGMWGILRVVS